MWKIDFKNTRTIKEYWRNKSTKGIYKAMKVFLNNGYRIEKKFNARAHNLGVEKQLKKILKNSWIFLEFKLEYIRYNMNNNIERDGF